MGFDLGDKIRSLIPVGAGAAPTDVAPTKSGPDPSVVDHPDLYDVVQLGGVESPGVVKITGHDRKINWDIKAGAGQAGATTTVKDIPPVEITLTIYMADDEDFNAWPAFRDQCNSTVSSNKKAKALDIYHPDLASNHINSVCLASMGGVVHDGKGGRTVVVKFQEYKPPKPVKLTPLGSISTGPDPNAAANAQIAALTTQFQNTPTG